MQPDREEGYGRKDGAHQRAVQEVQRVGDVAEPEEDVLREGLTQMRREKDREAEDVGAEAGPEAAKIFVCGSDGLSEMEELAAPGGPVRKFARVGAEVEAEEGERVGEVV